MFKNRSSELEMLDAENISRELLFQNLKELEFINAYLGGHRISLIGLRKILRAGTKVNHLIDIGCGGSDSLKAIGKWTQKNNMNTTLTGIDLKADCIEYSLKNCEAFNNIKFACDDFRNVFDSATNIDIVHAALFCHHFNEEHLISFIKLCDKNGAIFLINDLERNPIAYYAIKILTFFFSKSVLVKNDAPLSVKRGFKKVEWKKIIESAGIKKYSIQNYWAFRHLIIIYPNE